MTHAQTLLLNATFEPVKVISWQRAMTLLCLGKVEIIDEHDTEVRSVTFTFRLPSIVRLLKYVRVRMTREQVPFTRANIYRRDDYRCQYCGVQFASEDLTYDHVVPASQGGRRSWENIVAACLPCNREKDSRTPEEAGMPLRTLPRKPAPSPLFRVSLEMRKTPDSWRSWLYWNAELEV
jgi:5-methylcytosine-specific restriction endonuclease McrA